MTKEKRLTMRDIMQLYRIREELDCINERIEKARKNHILKGDNGDVCEQLSCACAEIDTILQDY